MGRIEERANQTGPPSPWSGPEVGAQVASQHCPILRSGHFQCSCPRFNPLGWQNRDKSWGSQGAKPPVCDPTTISELPRVFGSESEDRQFRKSRILHQDGVEGAECKNES